ncbi:hypothetical protein ACLB2K_077294 [Fragaria x ananassa]
MKNDVVKKGVLGTVVAYVYVIEFQKRGLPHVHMLLILGDDDKLNNLDDYDTIVRAEIPDQDEEPELYNAVLGHMIHGPIKSVKYLYKYVYKGPDRVTLEVRSEANQDEVRNYVDARWVCAPEALWRIFKFVMNRMYPSVERLQIHLPDGHNVYFNANDSVTEVVENESNTMTMLTEFFTKNNTLSEDVPKYLYREFPEHYRWDSTHKTWEARETNQKVIGRIYTVSPLEGEKFYLRVLLNHVRGPKSFEDIRKVDGITQPTFKKAAEQQESIKADLHKMMLKRKN